MLPKVAQSPGFFFERISVCTNRTIVSASLRLCGFFRIAMMEIVGI